VACRKSIFFGRAVDQRQEAFMAGSITSVSNNGIAAGNQTVTRAGSERQVHKDVGDLGKALAANDVAAAQSAVASLKNAAPTQNSGTDFKNAVKALDQALKSNDARGAAQAFANLQQAQKRIAGDQSRGPAQEVPNRPAVAGAADTAAIQKAASASHDKQAAEQSFITRQDLAAARSAQPKPAAAVGGKIDTTA
jgi:hypothetical protein